MFVRVFGCQVVIIFLSMSLLVFVSLQPFSTDRKCLNSTKNTSIVNFFD